MKVIQIENQITFLKCQENAVKAILKGTRDVQEKFLRDQFSSACVDATASAVIIVCEGMGFEELSKELKLKLSNN